MWGLDHKNDWGLKNWCFQIVVLEKTLESPLDCKEIKPINPKGNQPWTFIGRTVAKAEAPILWPPDSRTLEKKILTLGKTEDKRRRGWQRMWWLDRVTNWMDTNLSKFQEIGKDREARHATAHRVTKSQTQLTQMNNYKYSK